MIAAKRVRKKRKAEGILYLRNLPKDLKNLFRSTCVRRGNFMEDVAEALIRAYIRKPDMVRVLTKKERAAKDSRPPYVPGDQPPYRYAGK